MSRIVYVCLPSNGIAGGAKMIFRHVEALQTLGHEAVVRVRSRSDIPTWFQSNAAVDIGGPTRDDDVVVVPEDSALVLRRVAALPNRKFIFCQNHYYCVRGMAQLSPSQLAAYAGVIACSRTVADWVAWRFPALPVEVLPAFADERRFRPAPEKEQAIAFIPRKRRAEAAYLQDAFPVAHRAHATVPWRPIEALPEDEAAEVMGRSRVFLSLSRLEGLGMAPLEAMAAGCIVAGFTGGGGREYATPENGFWVADDDPDGAIQALAAAADLAASRGPELTRMLEACRDTAARWSHADFLKSLARFWESRSGAAPDPGRRTRPARM